MRLRDLFSPGDGTLKPELREALEAEGLVLLEEGLRGSIRYRHFKAPGRRHHGKVVPERFGLAVTTKRFALYCRSGSVKLIDGPFTDPRWDAYDVSLDGENAISVRIDYDKTDQPKIAGQITIRARTPNAATVVDELRSRLGRAPADG